jgi:hypothetical protein
MTYKTSVFHSFTLTALCLLSGAVLFVSCQEDTETIHPQQSWPENLAAALQSDRKAEYLAVNFNNPSDPSSMQLMTQAYHQFSPEEYEQFVRKEYDLKIAKGEAQDQALLHLEYRLALNQQSEQNYGVSFASLSVEQVKAVSELVLQKDRFAQFANALAELQATPNARQQRSECVSWTPAFTLNVYGQTLSDNNNPNRLNMTYEGPVTYSYEAFVSAGCDFVTFQAIYDNRLVTPDAILALLPKTFAALTYNKTSSWIGGTLYETSVPEYTAVEFAVSNYILLEHYGTVTISGQQYIDVFSFNKHIQVQFNEANPQSPLIYARTR